MRKPTASVDRDNARPFFERDVDDPGDATARNFRYQHAYGVILLVAAKQGKRPYTAIWCEHHEDFLAKRSDGKFDGYQIKTRRPERGAWKITDPKFVHAIARFVDLVTAYKTKIGELFFVSNAEYDQIEDSNKDELRRGRCPTLFLKHIRSCTSPETIAPPFLAVFNLLQAGCGCDADALFGVLKRTDLLQGPSRADFDAVLSNEHLGSLEECKRFTAEQLNTLRDDLVAKVYRASSLQTGDPIRHLRSLIGGRDPDPAVTAKSIVVTEIIFKANDKPDFTFPGAAKLKLGGERRDDVLEQKLSHGGIDLEASQMKELERAAEYNLLEDIERRPDQYPRLLHQIEQMVLQECSEAYLRARMKDEPYGPNMLIDVQDRLRRLAETRPAMIGNQEYECLIGVAALLTSECLVWWSPRFQVQVDSA